MKMYKAQTEKVSLLSIVLKGFTERLMQFYK